MVSMNRRFLFVLFDIRVPRHMTDVRRPMMNVKWMALF